MVARPQERKTRIKTGAMAIQARELKILTNPLRPRFRSTRKGVAENLRLKYRYLDLRRPHAGFDIAGQAANPSAAIYKLG
jgi:aspartyl-tRNA synthetase